MIQLFDVYNQESQDLHYSLTAAGLSDLTVVIEPDGFLPDGVVSPFTYYLGYDRGKPLYFNQVPVPDFWEIAGNNQFGTINDLNQERAVIHFADGLQARLVKKVEWKTPAGRIFQVDHYNRFGACFAKTTYDGLGQAIMTSYRNVDQKEVILENHVTGDILLTLEGQGLRHFSGRVAFIIDFLQGLKVNLDHILFNTLSTSFLTSFHFPEKSGQDILVWQEPLQDHIPGNMQLILENDQLRAKTIIIPDYATYERALQLTDEKFHHKFSHLGYHYHFKRDNFVRSDALIVTNSDQLEQIEKLVESLPRVTFRIAAVTEMSSKLLDMLRYPNVVLYQNASPQKVQELYQLSDIYLDINYGNELLQAVRQAFEHNQLVLAFEETAHNRRYTAPNHIFAKEAVDDMIHTIELALSHVKEMGRALGDQGYHANYVDPIMYQERMETILGESHD
ncbi:accessory Sec system glycosylation chaperone GtfB [Streptococcus sp. oral taxon 431]|uniref:accessory Sec system glycosylation chaperone GtfB n=1 Tax=Streptococcus sp. oral taxon 431 TaxID=712633 RepID=UPI0007682860|nr:accessory Sec system glycosylation chaperone GtfB [Streptococcus sp. oral taxon 431]AMD96354.1 accessory Sec system glycosylation chaperone GtfB [Streptococcus sp. oral taxon 431]